MQKNRYFIRRLVLSACLAALSVVLGKLLQIPVGDSIRISFENLPILFASLAMDPVWGASVGLVADLIGCAVMGYTVNPIITLGAVLVGVLPRLFCGRQHRFWRVSLSVLLTHVIASMLVKSAGLALYLGTPLSVLLWRVPVYLVIAVLESVLLYRTLNSRAISSFWKGEGES